MRQVERAFTVTYKWWREDKKQIRKAYIPVLEEAAMDTIWEKLPQGWLEGSLTLTINGVVEKGVVYRGHWTCRNRDVDLNGRLR